MKNPFAFILAGIILALVSCSTPKREKKVATNQETPIVKETDSAEALEILPQVDSLASPNTSIDSNTLRNPEALNAILTDHTALKEYQVCTRFKNYALSGDFYGDGVEDLALLIEKKGQVHLGIINYHDSATTYLFGENGEYDDYGWAGVFKRVPAGDTLWSNYEDDFRSFDEVPENEKVVLPYDAILAHALESCGGGFIFWKDGQFNWLQQE